MGDMRLGDRGRLNAGEFFATAMGAIERTPEFVRLVFSSDRQVVTIALPPSAFAMVAALIATCRDGTTH